jgi:hypothetical protein
MNGGGYSRRRRGAPATAFLVAAVRSIRRLDGSLLPHSGKRIPDASDNDWSHSPSYEFLSQFICFDIRLDGPLSQLFLGGVASFRQDG